MTPANSSPSPITGREPIGDLREPIHALSQFYRAFNERDLAMMEEVWEHSREVSAIPPIGVPRFGWRMLRANYEKGLQNARPLRTEFFDYVIQTSGDLFVAIGRERGQGPAESSVPALDARTTNIFRRGPDGRWKLLHHHVSFGDPHQLAEVSRVLQGPEAPPHRASHRSRSARSG